MARVFDSAIILAGRSSYDNGALVNLMLVDACRIADRFLIPFLHWGFWFSCIILFVGVFALYQRFRIFAFFAKTIEPWHFGPFFNIFFPDQPNLRIATTEPWLSPLF